MAPDNKTEDLDLSIDENNLAEEWQGQASLMLEYSVRLADAMQEADEAKANLAVVTADIEMDIRANPEEYGLAKLTEAGVLAAIPQQEAHEMATKTVNTTRHAVRVYQGAVDALSHRKAALQGMTDLYMRQWFADPTQRDQGPQSDGPTPRRKSETRTIPGRRPRKASKK